MIIRLPIPPSVNSMFVNSRNAKGRGRYKSGEYKAWLKESDLLLSVEPAGGCRGPYRVEIMLPWEMRGDLDNRIKPVLDFLVSRGITDDDKHLVDVRARRSHTVRDCLVEVEAYEERPPVVG